MGFDAVAAKKAGYSDAEIADFLADDQKFDTSGARKAGYSDAEIVSHLSSTPAPVENPEAASTYEQQRREIMSRQERMRADPKQGGKEAVGAIARGALRSALPTAAGVAAFTPGFTAGAGLGALTGPAAPVVSPLAGLVGGLATSAGVGYGIGKLQDKALDLLPDAWVRAMGQDDEQQAQDQAGHPYASMIGEIAPGFAFGRPSLSPTRVPPNATAVERVLAHPFMASAAGATIGGGQEFARELVTGEGLDPTKIAIATGAGALQNRNTRLGDFTMAAGDKISRATIRPATKGIDLGVDLLARRAAERQPGVPDVSAVADLVPAEALVARPMSPEIVPVPIEPVPTVPDPTISAVVEPRPTESVSPPAAEGGPVGRNDPLRPDPGPLADGERYVTTPAGNRIRTRFEVVDSRTLKPAEGELQNRDRSRASTDIQVQDIVSKFDPTRLGDSAETDRGAPIVGPDDVIESGNGRIMALNRVFDEFQDRAQAYREYLESQGHRPEGIERPVLVRRRVSDFTPEQRVQFVRDSNFDTKPQMGSAERAKTDAAGINGEALDLYRGGDVADAANRDFVRVVVGKLPPQEQAAFFTADGQISSEGIRRVRSALKAAAYDDAELLGTLDESQDNNIKSIGGALESNAAEWAKLRTEIADGKVLPQFDITKRLVEAAKAIRDLRQKGEGVRDFLAQVDAFKPRDPVTDGLIRLFYNDKLTAPASKQAITSAISDYVKRARAQLSDPGMFGNDGPDNPAELIDGILASRSGSRDQTSFLAAAEDRLNLDLMDTQDASSAMTDGSGEAPNRGAYQPSFAEASFTSRQSVYDSAVHAIGMEPKKFNLLPPARKARLLGDALERLTGIKVKVADDMPLQYAIDQMLDAHQTLQGMAAVLGIDTRALSLDNSLSLRLQKQGKFLGAFQSATGTILLPKRSNSFAHEWAHALDYHLLSKLTDERAEGLTGLIRNEGADFQPTNVQEAFVKLLNTMFFDETAIARKIMVLEKKIQLTQSDKQKAAFQTQIDNLKSGRARARERSDYYKNADQVNKRGGQGDYWTKPTEMFARAFEAFTAFKMAADGWGNEFVTKGDANYLSDAESRFRLTFPKGEERMRIFDAMQGVLDLVSAEQLVQGAQGGKVTPRIASGFDEAVGTGPDGQRAKQEIGAAERRTRGLVDRLFGADKEAFQIWQHNRMQAKEDAGKRAPDPLKTLQKMNNVRSLAFSAAADGVKMVAKRWNSKGAQAIMDHFAHDLGGTRHVGRTWGQAIEMRTNRALNPVMAQLQKLGSKGWMYKSLSTAQRDALRSLLLGKDVADDMGLAPLADAMRRAYNDEWYANQNAGVDLGYVNDTAYINRQIDRELVAAAPDKFIARAAEAYEHVFDRDTGPDGAAIAADAERLDAFVSLAAKQKADGLKELRQAMRADDSDPNAIAALVDDMLEGVRSAYAEQAAAAYADAILHVETFPDYTMTASLPNSEKRRALTSEADDILKDFYNPDPVSSLLHYVRNSVQRTEWAQRFGPAGEIAKQLDDQMAHEGVPEEDRRHVWALVDRMSGRYRRTGWLANKGVTNILGMLRVKGTLAMMGRAVTLSTFEPAGLGIVTANPWDGAKAVAKTWASVLHRGTRQELAEWGRAHGFIKHHLLEQFMMQDRFGTVSDTPTRWDHLSGWMFRNSGLTFLTNMSDAAVMDVARRGLINEISHRTLEGGKRGKEAANFMRELGIRDPDAFARQIVDLNGALPSDEWMNGSEGWDYDTALMRLAKMTIQKPDAADLAPLSRNPLASYATYSITSYIQSAYRHLLKRNVLKSARLAEAGEYENLLRFGAGSVLSAGLLYGLNVLASLTREQLFNPERQEKWEKDGWWSKNLALAASRTFSFGALDPVINSWSGLKYNRDLAYLPLGAYAGADAQNVTKIAQAFNARNSPKTNTAEYNALKSLYAFGVAPALAGGLAALPGGPLITVAAGGGTAYGTSPKAGDIFATAIVGKKGEKTKNLGIADRIAAPSRDDKKSGR